MVSGLSLCPTISAPRYGITLPRPPPNASRLRWVGSNSAVSLAPNPRLFARAVPRSFMARAVCSPSLLVAPKVPRNCDVPSMAPRGIDLRVPVTRSPKVGVGATRPSRSMKARSRSMRLAASAASALRFASCSAANDSPPNNRDGAARNLPMALWS